ncbi:phage distal tail protein [Paenibacillus sp. BAC0078]
MFAGAFNRTPFNLPYVAEVLFSVMFEPIIEVDSRLNLEMPFGLAFEVIGELQADMIREIPFIASIETMTEIQTEIGIEMPISAAFEVMTEFHAQVRYFHTDIISFEGNFAPGDRIVIDSQKMKITKNGQNIIHNMEGDFFDLVLGDNKLTYTDTAASRSVLIRVTHRDKYLY